MEEEITFLLDHVRNTDLVFIRNGREHDPEEAYTHMNRKYDHFRKKIGSAESFIEYSATRSTMSGSKYKIRQTDGSEVYAQDYLLGVLQDYRSQAGN